MRPKALVIAGPNGSGKSTLIRQLQSEPTFSFPENYINADDIERELAPDVTVNKAERERLAFWEARRRREQFCEEGVSHAFETVFSHTSNLLDLQRLRNRGFDLTLCWIATQDSRLNVERVKRRVEMGGHNIVEDKIRERYSRSFKLLPCAAEIARLTYVYDNSDSLVLTGYFTQGTWHSAVSAVPDYLTLKFIQQMQFRSTERKAMANSAGDDGLELPDAENGIYDGVIAATGTHYLVQEVVERGLLTLYRHDALWFAENPLPEWTGKTAHIRYGASQSGLAAVSFP